MKVRVFGFLFIIFIAWGIGPLFPEDFWEGNAVVVGDGEMNESGLYALSDSFPKYSKIVVRNLSNNKEVTVTVLDRIRGVSNVFLLVSKEAAKLLGMEYGAITHVRVSLSKEPGVVSEGMPGDLPYNPDPDINPAVNIPGESSLEVADNSDKFDEEKTVTKEPKEDNVTGEKVSKEKPEVIEKPREAGKKETDIDESVVEVPIREKETHKKEEKTTEKVEEKVRPSITKEMLLVNELAKEKSSRVLFRAPTQPEQIVLIEKPQTPIKDRGDVGIGNLPAGDSSEVELPSLEDLNVPSGAGYEVEKRSGISEFPGIAEPGVEEPRTEIVGGVGSKERVVAKGLEIEKKPEVMDHGPAKGEEKKKEISSAKPPVTSAEKPPVKKGEVVIKLEPTGPKPPPPVEESGEESEKEKPLLEKVENISEKSEVGVSEKDKSKVVESVKPPVEEKSEKVAVSTSKKGIVTVTTKELPKGAYFLQIAAYYSETLANKLVSSLSTSYPVTVLSMRKNGKVMYKVLVGPLNRDESGALLYWFKSKGYRDSFIKNP